MTFILSAIVGLLVLIVIIVSIAALVCFGLLQTLMDIIRENDEDY